MSASDVSGEWSFRVYAQRLVTVKAKSEIARKAAVHDAATNLEFAVEVPDKFSMGQLSVGGQYLADLRVYTQKNLEGVNKEFLSFFEAVDVNQDVEDFIKAYWVYPRKIRFELDGLEQP
jgi:hypothetical protein